MEPDLKSSDLCAYYKTVDPADVVNRMLSVGEYNRLVRAIRELNEIDELADDATIEAIDAEIKN